MTLENLRLQRRIEATPERVWDRISTPEGIARWWRPGDIAPVVGHEFTLDMGQWGLIACRVLEVEPLRRLAYRFGEFELVWALEPEESGTLLTLEHRGFDLNNPRHRFAFDTMGPGWRDTVLPRLAVDLEVAFAGPG